MFSSGKNLSSDESQRSDGEDVDEVDQDAVEDIENRDGPPTMWESSELIFVS